MRLADGQRVLADAGVAAVTVLRGVAVAGAFDLERVLARGQILGEVRVHALGLGCPDPADRRLDAPSARGSRPWGSGTGRGGVWGERLCRRLSPRTEPLAYAQAGWYRACLPVWSNVPM